MNLKSSISQPDPHVSFLDVIFCLVVFLLVLLMMSMSAQKLSDQQAKVAKASAKKQSKQKIIQSTRFRGRGGQPTMKINVSYQEHAGLVFKIARHAYSWISFRKMNCNFDRRESGVQPALIFQILYDQSYRNISLDVLERQLKGFVSRQEIENMKHKSPNNYVLNLYKKANQKIEKKCREFKLKNTTKHLGNWDVDEIGVRTFSNYSERKELGDPYLWFTVDSDTRMIILGPLDNPLRVSSDRFVDLIASVRGGDGFYIEYRSSKTLKYDKNEKIPDWVVREVIQPLGFSMVISGS